VRRSDFFRCPGGTREQGFRREEEVSEEDGEEYNPEHNASSSDEEDIIQAERETFLPKNS
jgi:hypothetical protein